jgi:autotransporter-associated beta strand protein
MNSTKNTYIINNAFGGSTLDFNPANISVVNTAGNLLLGNVVNATALNGVSVSGTTTVNTGARILMNVTGSANLGALVADGTVSLANSNDNSISRNVTVSSLAGGGVVRGNGSGSGTGITAGLTISGSSNSTFSGTIANGTGSVVSVTKSGSGTQTLSNANTYTGATTVTAGTLVLSSTGSIASSTIGFGVADSSNGLLTAENAAFSFGGALSLNLNTVTVTNASWTLFNGTTFGAGDLNLSGVTSNLAGLVFTNNSGIWSGTDLSFRTWTFSEDLGTLNVVPEPTTWVLLTIGLVIAVTFRSRRKSGLC